MAKVSGPMFSFNAEGTFHGQLIFVSRVRGNLNYRADEPGEVGASSGSSIFTTSVKMTFKNRKKPASQNLECRAIYKIVSQIIHRIGLDLMGKPRGSGERLANQINNLSNSSRFENWSNFYTKSFFDRGSRPLEFYLDRYDKFSLNRKERWIAFNRSLAYPYFQNYNLKTYPNNIPIAFLTYFMCIGLWRCGVLSREYAAFPPSWDFSPPDD